MRAVVAMSDRLSSGLVVEHCWGGEAGWKYPPLERAKDTQLLRAKNKRKRDGWMDGVMVKLPRRVGFGANYKVDAWGHSHHTTPHHASSSLCALLFSV